MANASDLGLAAAGAGATRPAVDQDREGGAVTGGLTRGVTVEHQQPTVPGRQAEDERAGDVGVVRDD